MHRSVLKGKDRLYQNSSCKKFLIFCDRVVRVKATRKLLLQCRERPRELSRRSAPRTSTTQVAGIPHPCIMCSRKHPCGDIERCKKPWELAEITHATYQVPLFYRVFPAVTIFSPRFSHGNFPVVPVARTTRDGPRMIGST